MDPVAYMRNNHPEVRPGPLIRPKWKSGTPYHVYGWISTEYYFKKFSPVKMREEGSLFLDHEDVHDITAPERRLEFNLVDDDREHGEIVGIRRSENMSQRVVSPKIWQAIRDNSTDVFLHVIISRSDSDSDSHSDYELTAQHEKNITESDVHAGIALYGTVRLVKHDVVPKHFKHRHLLSDFGYAEISDDDRVKMAMPSDTVISFFKPEVAVRLVADETEYPSAFMPESVRRLSRGQRTYPPVIYAEEIGLTSDKYIPLNASVSVLPLTVTMAPMSPQRWMMMEHMEESLKGQKELGFTEKDIDDVRRLIADTSVTLLAATMVASILHLLFEFLAFKSDIDFYRDISSTAGLSVKAICVDLVSQIVIFAYLFESNASLLVVIPAFFGIVIQVWKVSKAVSIPNKPPALLETEGEKETTSISTITREEDVDATRGKEENTVLSEQEHLDEIARVTIEADDTAASWLLTCLLPVTLAFMGRALVTEKYRSWTSFCITALTGAVYAFGFAFMLPQLFINHRLKSVSHLPWKYLIYKSINTFIDDLFAFIIKMPTMHRVSCFRDDIVFFIYVYQRYTYAVDHRRQRER